MKFKDNFRLDGLGINSHFGRTYVPPKALPPISPRTIKEMEEKPAAVITKFVEEVSNELKKEATLNIKESDNYFHRFKTEPNETDQNNKLNQTENNPFITEANEKKRKKTKLIRGKNPPIPVYGYISNSQRFNLTKCFRRIRTFQPHVNENWKFKLGLTHTTQNTFSGITTMVNNIDFQVKSIHDQIRLLNDNISYYKLNVVTKENYVEAFKSLSLKSQIKYNKYLEETIGIILLLPQLFLLEFYHYVEKLNHINVPDKRKFKDKYIFDEVECLFENNKILNDVVDFFNNCFEIYLTLVKEVDDMFLKPKNFDNLMSIIEKARYDISSAISCAENSISNYENDIQLVNKILKTEHKEEKFKKERVNLTDKLRAQFVFKKNKERQRIIRIQNALKLNDNDNYEEKRKPVKKEFHSIIHSKLIDGLLDYCKKGVKKQIQIKRIFDEMEPPQKSDVYTRDIVKLNF